MIGEKKRELNEKISLKQTFKKIHDHLYANSNISRNERLGQEFIKIIIAKHFDEKWETNIFGYANYSNFGLEFPIRLREFFEGRVLEILDQNGIFSKKDNLFLDDKSLIYIGLELGNLNFNGNSIDSLGAAFEVFSEGNLAGDQGQFFTPLFMVKLCVEMIEPNSQMKILDPACGSGGFLNYALRWISKKELNNREDFLENNILGVDKDSDLVKIARSFALFMNMNSNNFHNLDSLKILSDDQRLKEFDFREKYLGKIDLILTNPPFGSKIKITDVETLKNYNLGHVWKKDSKLKEWTQTKNLKETEPQILFIELCIELLKDRGTLAIVLPEGIFGNPSYGYVRDYIFSQGEVLAIVDCPHDSFMPHTHTKTSLLFFKKGFNENRKNIFMGRVNKCGYDSRGTLMLDKGGNLIEDFSKNIIKYRDFLKENLKQTKDHFTVEFKDLRGSALVPNHYNLELDSLIENSEDVDFISLGELEKRGDISITNIPASTSKQEYGSGEIPFIRTTDIGNGEILHPTIHYVSKDVFEKYGKKQNIKEFDILFVRDGTYRIGKSAMIFKEDLRSLIQAHFKLIRVNEQGKLDPFLIFYLLQQKIVQKQIQKNIFTQSTLSSIGNRVYDLKLPLPSNLEERKKLSNFAKEILINRNKYRGLLNSSV